MAFVRNDSELIDVLTVGTCSQILSLDTLAEEKPELHSRVIDALNHACGQIIDGKCKLEIEGRVVVGYRQPMYREEIVRLSQLLAATKSSPTKGDVQQELSTQSRDLRR